MKASSTTLGTYIVFLQSYATWESLSFWNAQQITEFR